MYQAINFINVVFHDPLSQTKAVFVHPDIFNEKLSKTLDLPLYENDILSTTIFHFLYLNIVSEYLFLILGVSSKISRSL
jgi:hypothetical protein